MHWILYQTTFLDYHKALDSTETWAILHSMDREDIEPIYSQFIENICKNAILLRIDRDGSFL